MTDTSLSFVLLQSPVSLSVHQTSGAFVIASSACAALLGVSAAALCGQSLFDFVNPLDEASVRSAWNVVCAAQSPTTTRFRLRPSASVQDVRWIEAQIGAPGVPTRTEGAAQSDSQPTTDMRQLVLCLREITEQVQADAQRTERLEQAEQAERHRDHLAQMLPGRVVACSAASYAVLRTDELGSAWEDDVWAVLASCACTQSRKSQKSRGPFHFTIGL